MTIILTVTRHGVPSNPSFPTSCSTVLMQPEGLASCKRISKSTGIYFYFKRAFLKSVQEVGSLKGSEGAKGLCSGVIQWQSNSSQKL